MIDLETSSWKPQIVWVCLELLYRITQKSNLFESQGSVVVKVPAFRTRETWVQILTRQWSHIPTHYLVDWFTTQVGGWLSTSRRRCHWCNALFNSGDFCFPLHLIMHPFTVLDGPPLQFPHLHCLNRKVACNPLKQMEEEGRGVPYLSSRLLSCWRYCCYPLYTEVTGGIRWRDPASSLAI